MAAGLRLSVRPALAAAARCIVARARGTTVPEILPEPNEFEVGGKRLVIFTESASRQPQQLRAGVRSHPDSASGGWTGGTVWESGVILAHYLPVYAAAAAGQRASGEASWADCRVLELGSGCGLVGLAAAALGAKQVVLTDQVLHQARMNRDANFADADNQVQLRQLIWSETSAKVLQSLCAPSDADQMQEECLAPFDLLLGSDILYSEANHGALAQTIVALSGPATVVLLCTPIGQANWAALENFFGKMKSLGFSCEDISAEAGLETSETGDSDGSAVMLYSPDGELESM